VPALVAAAVSVVIPVVNSVVISAISGLKLCQANELRAHWSGALPPVVPTTG